ncbi:MAG: class I SAM-dependent methyltransferase [Solirubrobacteraceae bacterium]
MAERGLRSSTPQGTEGTGWAGDPPDVSANQYHPWDADFRARIDELLRPGMRILDVGAGRQPVLAPAQRPPRCRYSGLDMSKNELARAQSGSYDDFVVSDISVFDPSLHGTIDLIISWQVLEHVKPLEDAFANMRAYLQPGGHLVAFFSGAFSVFGLVNRVLPDRVGRPLVAWVMNRDPETVFPAPYDGCHPRALRRMLASWSDWQILPTWGGAAYLSPLPPVQRAYLWYEAWAERENHASLATHYLVTATK